MSVCVCMSVWVCRWVKRFKAVDFLKHSYKLTCACVRIYSLGYVNLLLHFETMTQINVN